MDLMGNNRTNSDLSYAAVNPESLHLFQWIFFFVSVTVWLRAGFGAEMIILLLDQEQHKVGVVIQV